MTDRVLQIHMVMEALLPGSVEDLMGMNLSMSPKKCIFRIPTVPSSHNEQAYKPNAFSIGPFHYGSEKLRRTQKIKLKCLQDLLSRTSNQKELYEQLLETVWSVQEEAREYYAGPIEPCDDEQFVKILLLDSCFILELFRKNAGEVSKDDNDPIFSMSILLEFLNHDLILLENQIPWVVLDRLFELTIIPGGKSLIQLALEFFPNIFSPNYPRIEPVKFQGHQVKHILDLLRLSLLIPIMPMEIRLTKMSIGQNSSRWELLPGATKIRAAGIKLKNVAADSILDVRFLNGLLEIPTLLIQKSTETIFRNLISFEQCCPNYVPWFTSYAKLMGSLIGTTEDVEILSENYILDNWLNPMAVTQFFKQLYDDTYVKTFPYYDVCRQVKLYRDGWWPRFRTTYAEIYLSSPSAMSSQLYTVLGLYLTLLQTVYTILSSKE